MQKKYFDELQILYIEYKENYAKRIERQRQLLTKQVKTKGKKYSVIPYSEERLGNKLSGKIVDEIEMKDNNYIYYFDAQGKIRLIEEACSFLGKIYSFEYYDYYDDKIYQYRGNLSRFGSVKLSILDNDKIQESYIMYEPGHFVYERYLYKDNILSQINVYRSENGKVREWHENFYFDNSKLKLIQRIEGIYKLNCYCNEKINYKKIANDLENQIVKIYPEGKTSVLTIWLNLESEISNIELMFGIVDKEYATKEENINEIPLRKFSLDCQEKEKILNTVLKAIVRLWNSKSLEDNVYLRIIKDGSNILENDSIIPNWVKNDLQISFDKDLIRYKYIKKAEQVKSKTPRELAEDLKKSTNKKMSLECLLDIFEGISKIPVKDISEENIEELFLMQAETVLFNKNLMFGISLIRQIPFEEEFLQLGIEVLFELDDKNKMVSSHWWSDKVEGDFFSFVKSTDIYLSESKKKVYDIRIFLEET